MKPVVIGDLLDKVQIQSQSSVQDSYGQNLRVWQTIATLWAQVTQEVLSETRYGESVIGRVAYKVVVRKQPQLRLKSEHRIVWKGRILEIISVAEDVEFVTLLAKEKEI